jgi:hypothetical protein
MLVVSALWMDHAWSQGSWEQVAGNAVTGMAALYGVCRVTVLPMTGQRMRLWSRSSSQTVARAVRDGFSKGSFSVLERALGNHGQHTAP